MNDLTGKRILVTGGAGLVGSHIVDELVREGAGEIIVFDSLIRGKREHLAGAQARGKLRLVEGDITDRAALKEALAGVDYVFHQAGMWLRQCEADPRRAVEVNIVGSFNVLEACVEAGVKKVVAASSSSVYGEGLYLPTDEDHPFNNDLFYGATKVALEQLLRSFHRKYGLDYVAFRYLNVYGPRQPFQAAYMDVIMHFLNRIEAGESPIIHGDGSQSIDLVFVEDVARANVMAMKSDLTNVALNVAGGKETTLKELAELLIRLSGKDLQLVFEPRDSKLVSRRWGCPKKAKKLLGFEVTTPIEAGMRKVIVWRKGEIQ